MVGGRGVYHLDLNLGGSRYEGSKLFGKYQRLWELGVLEVCQINFLILFAKEMNARKVKETSQGI